MKKHLSTLLLAPLFISLLSISLLTSCDGWFKPKTMTIEYDEEVKLHDGSMIWVHITRHYFYASEPSHGGAYMPSSVEISWDTGFKGVGRRSFVFQAQIYLLDKIDNKWYVYGSTKSNTVNHSSNATICNSVGTLYFNKANCLIRMNSMGEFLNSDTQTLSQLGRGNILYSYSIKDWGAVPKSLNGKKLSWSQKLNLQKFQPKEDRNVDVQLF